MTRREEFETIYEYLQGKLTNNPKYEFHAKRKDRERIKDFLENEIVGNLWNYLTFQFNRQVFILKDGENEHKRICGLPLNSLWNTTLETLSRKKKPCLIPIWIKKDSFILILREDTSFVKAMMGFCIMKRNAKDAGI